MCFTDYEPPQFFSQAIRMAAKTHRCCECNQDINPGTLYESASGKWEGEFGMFATCPACYATRVDVHDREIAAGCWESESWPPFGGLYEYTGQYDPPIERRSLEYGIALMQAKRIGSKISPTTPAAGA